MTGATDQPTLDGLAERITKLETASVTGAEQRRAAAEPSSSRLSGALKPEIRDYVPSDSDLNLAARDAIRSFVWKLVAPSALALAVLSGVGTFVIKDYLDTRSYERASEDARKEINSAKNDIVEADKALFNSKANLDSRAQQLAIKVDELDKKAASVQKTSDLLDQLSGYSPSALAELKDILKKFAAGKEVVAPKAPDTTPVKQPSPALSDFDKFIHGLATDTSDRPPAGGGYNSRCPAGSYAVGIDLAVSSGGEHGIVYGGRIVCRNFPLPDTLASK